MRHPVKRAVRDVLVPAATHLPAVQRRAARRLSQLSVGYPSSPLVQADGGWRATQAGAPVPGRRGSHRERRHPAVPRAGRGPARADRAERPGPGRTRLHRAEPLHLAGQRRRGLRRRTRRLRPCAPRRHPRRSRVREGRSPGHDLPTPALRSRPGPHGQQLTRGVVGVTLNARQVRAAAWRHGLARWSHAHAPFRLVGSAARSGGARLTGDARPAGRRGILMHVASSLGWATSSKLPAGRQVHRSRRKSPPPTTR